MVGIAAGVAAVATVAGSAISSSAAQSAAKTQASAANRAADMQQQQYEQVRGDLLPYNLAGQSNLSALSAYPGSAQNALTAANAQAQAAIPGRPDTKWLEQQPGYQFSLDQAGKQLAAQASSRGLGMSGALLKGISNYSTGLASQNYNNYFNQAQTLYGDQSNQFTNTLNQLSQGYNQYLGNANLGENAAARSGAIGQQGAATAGNALQAAGQASAAGISQSANNIAGGLSSLGNGGYNYLAWQSALKSNAPSTPKGDGVSTNTDPGGIYD